MLLLYVQSVQFEFDPMGREQDHASLRFGGFCLISGRERMGCYELAQVLGHELTP
jgi:hypothetical protein